MYIPVSLVPNGRTCFDLVTSIVAAEGLAPMNSRVFDGLGTVRSSATPYTGGTPLNPSPDVLAFFDKMPDVRRAEEASGMMFVQVADNAVVAAAEVRSVPGVPGCRATAGSIVFDFTGEATVELVFLDAENLEICRGCLGSPAAKNAGRFRLRLATPGERTAAQSVDADLASALDALFTPEERAEAVRLSIRRELADGASLGARLAEHVVRVEAETRARAAAKDLLAKLAAELARIGRGSHEAEAHRAALASLVGNPVDPLPCSRAPEPFDAVHRELLDGFCAVAEQVARDGWCWSDDACRASFCRRFRETSVEPVLARRYAGEPKTVAAACAEVDLVVRRFREPNTFFVDDASFHSAFMKALWAVMFSEGRPDRILETVDRHRGTVTARLALALYGAMKGYARLPCKQLVLRPKTTPKAPPCDVEWQPERTPRKKSAVGGATRGRGRKGSVPGRLRKGAGPVQTEMFADRETEGR